MKTYRRILISLLCLLMLLSGCGPAGNENKEKKVIVTTIFPLYDWARNIVKDSDDIELVLLMDKGSDLHNYQPSVNDIITVTDCDLFIYVGGESDEWAEDLISQRENRSLNLMAELSEFLKEEESTEGMQVQEEEDGYDEHIWLSLRIARKACEVMEKEISILDRENSSNYLQNCREYTDKLKRLDTQYDETVSNAERNVVLFADRFPFRYLTEDYDLKYYAAFKGCSAESEASFETIRTLAEKVDEHELKHILILENNDGKIARTIIESTANKDQEIVAIDSLQSVTGEDAASGVSYLTVMENNLEVLRKVLN